MSEAYFHSITEYKFMQLKIAAHQNFILSFKIFQKQA